MILEPSDDPYRCQICARKFTLPVLLVRHLREHKKVDTSKSCEFCGKKCISKWKLRRHLLTHSNERAFKCTHCQKSFKHVESLRDHEKLIHNKQLREYVPVDTSNICEFCDKKFKFKSKLIRHLLTHSNERAFKCQKSFKRADALRPLRDHEKPIHNKQLREYIPVDISNICEFCDKKFKFKSKLIRHLGTHTNDHAFQCGECQQYFKFLTPFRQHKRMCTKSTKTILKCPDCLKVFSYKACLQRHMRVHLE